MGTILDPAAAGNTAFSLSTPGLQIAWDSTSLGALKECPRKYQYSIMLAKAPRETSVHLAFGLHYHAALEWYDHQRAQGASHSDAYLSTIRRALQLTWNRALGRPWLSDDKYKNRLTLVRSIAWYLDQFAVDALQTVILSNGKPAVELSFQLNLETSAPSGEPYLLCGHIDRLVLSGSTPFVLDRKTTKTTITPDFFDKYSPDNQFSTYSFAAKIIYQTPAKGLIVDAAQIAVGFTRFQRGIVNRTEEQLNDWFTDTITWLRLAEGFAQAQYWPQNDKSCGNYGGCPFRSVCSKGPSTRDLWLERDFQTRVWNPLIARGDV